LVEFEGERYRYVHSLQGDIIAIVDSAGNTVVEYKYDAWGKPTATNSTIGSDIADINPFGYRGYVWDTDVALYCLWTRCYSPKLSRFINEDSALVSAQKIGGMNVFAYCVNKPVQGYDPKGKRYIDALSVQKESREQRKRDFQYTKQTRPKKASKLIVEKIDEYLFVRNFKRLTDVYVYQDGQNEYYYTIIGGMWKKERIQWRSRFEKFNAVFEINTYESLSVGDLISYGNDIAGVLLSTYSEMPVITRQSEMYSNMATFSDLAGHRLNQVVLPDWMNEPIFTWDSTELVRCSIIS